MTETQMILDTKKMVKVLCKKEGAEGLESLMIESINNVITKMLIEFPELKNENPKEIGEMVKGMAFAYMQALTEVA